jgi:hypothetical protein
MEGQRGDAAYVGIGGRVAGCTSGDALFPTQDAENKFSDRVLGHCPGMAGDLMDVLEWETATGLRGCSRLRTDGILYRSRRNYPRKQHRVSDPTPNASHMHIVIVSSFRLPGLLLDAVLRPGTSWSIHARTQSLSSSPWCPTPDLRLALQKREH